MNAACFWNVHGHTSVRVATLRGASVAPTVNIYTASMFTTNLPCNLSCYPFSFSDFELYASQEVYHQNFVGIFCLLHPNHMPKRPGGLHKSNSACYHKLLMLSMLGPRTFLSSLFSDTVIYVGVSHLTKGLAELSFAYLDFQRPMM